jgi:hypothetical protein
VHWETWKPKSILANLGSIRLQQPPKNTTSVVQSVIRQNASRKLSKS